MKKKHRFLKNRSWKSKFQNRLKGMPEEICRDFINGLIDPRKLQKKGS